MHIRLIAVGDRQPAWVTDAFRTYTDRYPPQWKFRLDALRTERRSKGNGPEAVIDAEGARILGKLRVDEQVILLDERGVQWTSDKLATRLSTWQSDGRDLCFVIGGPDGVSKACRQRADTVWSLSSLTLPHGVARVLFAEQLYRAWSLLSGHPYHRV